jgi:hypothetical protein
MPRKLDLMGRRFGRLVALYDTQKRQCSHVVWCCECDCAQITYVTANHLLSGATQSCGCLLSDTLEVRNLVHGCSTHSHRTGAYKSWLNAKTHCYNNNREDFHNYGGRGIIMCQDWIYSFAAFLSDMGERPEGMTLDRIDVQGNYEPGNCRWATMVTQNNNKRSNKPNLPAMLDTLWKRDK